MTRTSAVCALLLLAAGLADPPARAQVCIDFLLFCDGLELNVDGDQITGMWRNNNCFGKDTPVVGVIQDGIPNPCHSDQTGRVGVACLLDKGCDVADDEWYWVFNEPNGILGAGNSTAGILPPPGACVFDISYQVLMGACPFSAPEPGETPISSLQAAGR